MACAAWATVLLALLTATAGSAASLTADRRAHRRIPGAAFSGVSHSHASASINAALQRPGQRHALPTRPCEEFSSEQLDKALLALAGASAAEFGELYEQRGDNRQLEGKVGRLQAQLREEHAVLLQLNRTNSSLGAAVAAMARDRKCTQAVLRYAHHLSDKRRALVGELIEALPLLPLVTDRATALLGPASAASPAETWAPIVDEYKKTVRALDCHLVVTDGCPGGDIEGLAPHPLETAMGFLPPLRVL